MRGVYEMSAKIGQSTISEVADEMGMSKSTIREYIEILEAASLVEKMEG